MAFTLEEKTEIIQRKPSNLSVKEYCNNLGIGTATYYNWRREIGDNDKEFIDITKELISDGSLDIKIGEITISITNDYNESLLLKLLKTLSKL